MFQRKTFYPFVGTKGKKGVVWQKSSSSEAHRRPYFIEDPSFALLPLYFYRRPPAIFIGDPDIVIVDRIVLNGNPNIRIGGPKHYY